MNGVWVERTPAAKRFRERTGFANHRLNTIVVGLEAVKSGVAIKPPDLAVRWGPKDVKAASDQARSYAINAIMVYAVDALDTYMIDLARAGVWISDPGTASTLANDFQIDKSDVRQLSPKLVRQLAKGIGDLENSDAALEKVLRDFTATYFGRRKRPSIRLRFAALVDLSGNILPQYNSAVQLLISWRNRHVHGRSTERVSDAILTGLRDGAMYFYENHAHLDVDRMIKNYEQNGSPTLKEVSSLISVLQRVIATADGSIINLADARSVFVAALKSGFSILEMPEQRVKHYWGMDIEGRKSKLIAMASQFGFRQSLDGNSFGKPLFLPDEHIGEIAKRSRDDFIDLLEIKSIAA